MPHVVLEYSANLQRLESFAPLFAEVHQVLNSIGGINLANCKSRARSAEDFFIGDGDPENAFIHLSVEFVAGRSIDVKQQIGRECLRLLQQYFHLQLSEKLQITVAVNDILLDFYFKYPEGTLGYQ